MTFSPPVRNGTQNLIDTSPSPIDHLRIKGGHEHGEVVTDLWVDGVDDDGGLL